MLRQVIFLFINVLGPTNNYWNTNLPELRCCGLSSLCFFFLVFRSSSGDLSSILSLILANMSISCTELPGARLCLAPPLPPVIRAPADVFEDKWSENCLLAIILYSIQFSPQYPCWQFPLLRHSPYSEQCRQWQSARKPNKRAKNRINWAL